MICSLLPEYLPGNEADSSGYIFTKLADTVVARVPDLFGVLGFATNSSGVDRIEPRLGFSGIARLSGFNALKFAREYSEEKRPRANRDVSAVDHLLRPLLPIYFLCNAVEFLLDVRPLDDSCAPRGRLLSHGSPGVLFFADERKEWVAS